MQADEDPYQILGVERTATESEIRTAYRKAALKHHPDKQSSDEARAQSTKVFAKIANAYEILSDTEQRAAYDREQSAPRFDDLFHHAHFHDPFAVFESVFREEFGGEPSIFRRNSSRMNDPFSRHFGMDPFGDAFGGSMMDPFGGNLFGGSLFGGSVFGGDPRQQPSQRSDPFADMFASMRGGGGMGQLPRGGSNSSYSFTSTSTTIQNGESVTTSTTRQVINGRESTVTERIVRKPDGTVERQHLVDGVEQAPALEQDHHRRGIAGHLPWRRDSSHPKRERRPSEPSPRKQRKSSKQNDPPAGDRT